MLLVELLNRAIEAKVDQFGERYHELSRVAKDTGSAAVGISLLLVILGAVTVLVCAPRGAPPKQKNVAGDADHPGKK